LYVAVFIPTIVFKFGHIRPFQRGFFCDDDSIRYPYKSNTIPWWAVGVVGLLVPAITVSSYTLCQVKPIDVTILRSTEAWMIFWNCE